MDWQPSPKYRYAFKRDMVGIDVWALQINLFDFGKPITLDGDFGPQTEKAVLEFQTMAAIPIDGIAGILTQRSLILRLTTRPSTTYRLPAGLLKSIASNESGFAVAAYSPHPSDDGFDIGPFQAAFPPSIRGETNYRNAYSAWVMGNSTAKALRAKKDEFRDAKYVNTDRYAWQLATLYHNWPVAATNLANRGSIFQNSVQDYQRAQWVVDASAGRMTTPRQWVDHYIAAATAFVTNWPA